MKIKTMLLIAVLSLILSYSLTVLAKYIIYLPTNKINPKIQEIIQIEQNTLHIKRKIEQEKKEREKKEKEKKVEYENYIKTFTPTKEEIEQSKSVYRIIDFNKVPDKKAVDIFYNYIMKEHADCAPACTNEILSKDLYYAYFIDLNDDKVNEIIGIVNHLMFRGFTNTSVFVLRKRNDDWEDINPITASDFRGDAKVLNHKTNGYRDICLKGTARDDITKLNDFVVQYNGKIYSLAYNLGLVK